MLGFWFSFVVSFIVVETGFLVAQVVLQLLIPCLHLQGLDLEVCALYSPTSVPLGAVDVVCFPRLLREFLLCGHVINVYPLLMGSQ